MDSKLPKIAEVLEDAVKRLTQILAEGSRLLSLVLLHHLESGLPIPVINQTFIYRVFNAVTTSELSVFIML